MTYAESKQKLKQMGNDVICLLMYYTKFSGNLQTTVLLELPWW